MTLSQIKLRDRFSGKKMHFETGLKVTLEIDPRKWPLKLTLESDPRNTPPAVNHRVKGQMTLVL